MNTRKVEAALLMLGIVFWGTNAMGGDIEPGTFSVGASSNAAFYLTDYDEGHSRDLVLDTEFGYFIYKNLEIGMDVGLRFGKSGDTSFQSYTLLPYLGYHWSLNDNSNIYGRIGGGYGLGSTDNDDWGTYESEESIIFAELGYEYFLSRNISLGLGVRGEKVREKYERNWEDSEVQPIDREDESVYTTKQLSTRLNFKIYF